MKKTTRSWIMLLVLFFFCVFLLWLFWSDLERLVQTQKPPQEKILEEDRKQLEEILKRRK